MRAVVDFVASVAVIAGVGLLAWQQFRKPAATARRELPVPTETVALDAGMTKGHPEARFALIEFSDFECPFCQKFSREILPTIDSEFVEPGLVRVSFKHYPLVIHKLAPAAARASECARQQQQFWPIHDKLFAGPDKLNQQVIDGASQGLAIETSAYQFCLASTATQTKIDEDTALAKKLSITGTPTFFFGEILPDGRVRVTSTMTGARPVDDFRRFLAPSRTK